MSKLSVDTFRAKFKKVKDFWYKLEDAAKATIRTKRAHRVGYIEFDISGPFMRMKLPSGRYLHYWKPKIQKRKMPWKDRSGQPVYKDQITYEQIEKNQWRRVTTHPGKLTENAVQAVARDILAHGMTLADRAGLDLRLHVHDQAVAVSAPEDAPFQLADEGARAHAVDRIPSPALLQPFIRMNGWRHAACPSALT